MGIQEHSFSCPWCGELNEAFLEPDDAGHAVIQDCSTCCRPIELVQHSDGLGGSGHVQVRREGD